LLFFVLLELVLRLAGVGHPASFFLTSPMNGRDVLVENTRFEERFFGPELARKPVPFTIFKPKPRDTVRVFVFGESAAGGDPQEEFGLPRMLEALLSGRYPGVRFEVVNAAMVAINSHAILTIARDCARLEGDIWVVYMGNNEVVGPYGPGTIFGPKAPPLALIRASLALKATRTGQGLEKLARRVAGPKTSQSEWGGMKMFVQNQVRQDDPRMGVVYSHFERNLEDILRVGLDHGAGIVLSTVASNLKDCAPFASQHRPALTAAELAEWDRLYQKGTEDQQAGRIAEAADRFREAAAIDDSFAELHFRRGQCSLALGQKAEAGRHFTLARDQDVLRFRADSRINDIIRRTASAYEPRGVLLADGQEALAQGSPQDLPGEELLYEHVHLNFEGNYRLARIIASQAARLLPAAVTRRAGADPTWPSMEDCAQRLAWTDWSRSKAQTEIFARMSDLPFTLQFNHGEQTERLRRELQRLLPAAQPAALKEAAARTREALVGAPDDWFLHKNLALLQRALGDVAGAAASWRRVTQLLPCNPDAWLTFGEMLAMENRNQDALAAFQQALRLDEACVGAYYLMGLVFARQGNEAEAARCFKQALALKPGFSLAHWYLGQVLEKTGKPAVAQEHFRRALDRRGATADTLNTLGRLCYERSWFQEAATNYMELLRLNPADGPARVGLGLCANKLGHSEAAAKYFAEAIQLNPHYANAHFQLGVLLGQQRDDAGALKQFTEAVRLAPDWQEARLNLAIALMSLHQDQEAAAEFQEVLRRNPTNAIALKFSRSLRAKAPAQP